MLMFELAESLLQFQHHKPQREISGQAPPTRLERQNNRNAHTKSQLYKWSSSVVVVIFRRSVIQRPIPQTTRTTIKPATADKRSSQEEGAHTPDPFIKLSSRAPTVVAAKLESLLQFQYHKPQ